MALMHYDLLRSGVSCCFAFLAHISCLSLQIEGRGNGIKTNAVNLVDVSKALERPTECEPSGFSLAVQ